MIEGPLSIAFVTSLNTIQNLAIQRLFPLPQPDGTDIGERLKNFNQLEPFTKPQIDII